MLRAALVAALLGLAPGLAPGLAWAAAERVDVALVLAVDVSESVDSARFTLQMAGIAAAFEAPEVQAAVLSGPRRSMLIALVQWSNRPALSVPWTLLTSTADVHAFATQVRRLRRAEKGFTCMSVALRSHRRQAAHAIAGVGGPRGGRCVRRRPGELQPARDDRRGAR